MRHTLLPDGEEAQRATQVHKEIIKTSRIVETPVKAERELEKLVSTLPQRMRDKGSQFSLNVFNEPRWNAWTVGAGYRYITQLYLDILLAVENQQQDLLAFVLAHELGHVCHRHHRFGYQLLWLQEELKADQSLEIDNRWLQDTIATTVQISGRLVKFLSNRKQVYRTDLFLLQLCRNAGFDLENCLDTVWVMAANPDLAVPVSKPGAAGASPLQRMKRLQMELNGSPGSDEYGLFEYRQADNSLLQMAGDD